MKAQESNNSTKPHLIAFNDITRVNRCSYNSAVTLNKAKLQKAAGSSGISGIHSICCVLL
jgi:hypothetical protein